MAKLNIPGYLHIAHHAPTNSTQNEEGDYTFSVTFHFLYKFQTTEDKEYFLASNSDIDKYHTTGNLLTFFQKIELTSPYAPEQAIENFLFRYMGYPAYEGKEMTLTLSNGEEFVYDDLWDNEMTKRINNEYRREREIKSAAGEEFFSLFD